MPNAIVLTQEMAHLRHLAQGGDKSAHAIVAVFDALRSEGKEISIARAATTANRTLSGLTSTVLDGQTPDDNDVILVKSQTDAKENGLYLAHTGTWERLKNYNNEYVLTPGMLVYVRLGTTLTTTMWVCTSTTTVVGTDDINYSQFLGAAVSASSIVPTGINGGAYFEYHEDFILASSGTLPPPLAKDLNNSATGDYLNDILGGVYSLATAAVSEAQDAQLTFANQNIIDPTKGPIFEARVRVNIPGATITADERWVVGLCSDHTNSEDSLDNTVTNVWFRGEGANLNIFIEGDDGTHDTDDTDSTVDYVDNAYLLFKIDMTSLAAVKMYIDGVLIGTTLNLSSLTNANVLQPIFCYQRDAGSEINLLQVDWFRIVQGR